MKVLTRHSPGRLALVFVAVVFAWPLRAEERHALLIGCTVYPNFASNLHLVGPANDVLLAKKLLVERFQFPEKNVTVLADNQGKPNSLPTRTNIEREWRRLANVAKQGDQLVVLMAGHGTQSPQREWDEDNPENDGLDEVFLPRDVGGWNAKTGELENAIKDDDIRDWISTISETGASLWVIIDACNSGTMTRHASDEVKRELRPDVLGVPQAAMQQAHALAASHGGATTENEVQLLESAQRVSGAAGATFVAANAPVVVALYAAQSIEPTVEKLLPLDAAEKKYYGLLTYTLCEILTQAQSPMTYRELVGQIHRRYVGMNRTSPTPVLEGTAIDREVLGLDTFPERSRIVLEQDQNSGGWKINSGALSGTTKHSVLGLYPPAGEANADQLLGHVKVLDDGLQALEAQVAPCAYDDLPAPAKLATGMRCETVFRDYGDQRLKIAVDRLSDYGESLPADEVQELEMSLHRFVRENAHLAQLTMPDHADWLLRYDDDQSKRLFVMPATGSPGREQGAELPALFGPAPTGDAFDSWLSESLTRIARAQTLLRVSAQGMEEAGILDIQIVRYRNKEDNLGQPVEFGRGDVKLYDQDRIEFQVENTSRVPQDVTLLVIDSGFGIYPLFPTGGRVNRLFLGNKVPSLAGEINAETIGKEYLVVLAVTGNPVEQPVSFAFLSQPTLERTRSGLGRGKHPLGALLSDAMFGGAVEMTRGSPSHAAEDYHIYTRSWTTMPTTRSE